MDKIRCGKFHERKELSIGDRIVVMKNMHKAFWILTGKQPNLNIKTFARRNFLGYGFRVTKLK